MAKQKRSFNNRKIHNEHSAISYVLYVRTRTHHTRGFPSLLFESKYQPNIVRYEGAWEGGGRGGGGKKKEEIKKKLYFSEKVRIYVERVMYVPERRKRTKNSQVFCSL